MATYAVGDLQGCLEPLKCLLKSARFNWDRDRLWMVGDLVNRGPDSLKTLRYVYKRRDNITCVLGNHDLHLLAVASGLRKRSRGDTLDKVLVAQDRDELLRWLRHQPLIHSEGDYTLVHAGIPHIWTLEQAHEYAAEVEAALRGPEWRKFLSRMYGNTPRRWNTTLEGYRRLRTITNYLTRMRFVYANGQLDLTSKGNKPNPGREVAPWFSYAERPTRTQKLVFGHWAALQGNAPGENLFAMDTGCVWGQQLSLLCLDTGEWFRCDCS
ncbi:MAG: symmetrical bis(5'-nucleosyl)-tetraphosphatase [Pseudomonadota bacterium]